MGIRYYGEDGLVDPEQDRPTGEEPEAKRRRLPAGYHAGIWELITVFLIILAWVSLANDWRDATAIAGTSIATATLALMRNGK